MNPSEENDIRQCIQNDDPKALELLYDEIGKKLYGYILSIVRSAAQAEDVMQNVFVRIAEKRHKIAKAENMTAYIFTLARNETMEYLRRLPKRKESIEEHAALFTVAEDPPDDPLTADDAKEISTAVRALPLEQREIIMLKIFHDRTFDEISRMLKISQNTAASRYRYGMEKLKKSLRRFKDEL